MYIEANMEEIERQKFNRELNISWVDENLPKADNAIILKHYFSSLVVYGIVLLFIWFNPFFSKMLAYPLKVTFNYFYLYYMWIYLWLRKRIYIIYTCIFLTECTRMCTKKMCKWLLTITINYTRILIRQVNRQYIANL